MTTRHFLRAGATVLLALSVCALLLHTSARLTAEKLPSQLTDQEFWRLATTFSEPDGTFHSENLVSNEARFQTVIPTLTQRAVPGRAYVGVGSEQNFTYMAAVRPAVAFIVDIRRGNLDLHLAYKALFEQSADRADFVSRLFSRKRPAGLGPQSTAVEIFDAYAKVPASQDLYAENLRGFLTHLSTKHGFALSAGDREGIEFVYKSWFTSGPDIRYELTTGGFGRGGRGAPGGFPSYADLMAATDGDGRARSYLAREDSYKFIKDLETRNLIVPVVGNFGGPKALRAVASYLKQKEMVVSAFYASNVEQYLRQDGLWDNFCASAATMPVDATSVFIRSERGGFGNTPGGRGGGPGGFSLELVPMTTEVGACGTAR
jgi:hypothetical protein